MSRLLVLFGLGGVLFGVFSAAVMHYLPVGELGWFAFTPLPDGSDNWLLVTPNWMPAIVVVPAFGAVAGLLAAVLLHRLGWRLVRNRPSPPGD